MEQMKVPEKSNQKRKSKLKGKPKSRSIDPVYESNLNSQDVSIIDVKQKAQIDILKALSVNLIEDDAKKFEKLKYNFPVRQQFAQSQQRSEGQRFLTEELVNKFILLIILMVVMVLLGVVTPNTIFAHRKPQERNKANIEIKTQLEKMNLKTDYKMSNLEFLKEMKGFHQKHLKVYQNQVIIPQQEKIGLDSEQNNLLFRPNKRSSDFILQMSPLNDFYSFQRPNSIILENFIKQNAQIAKKKQLIDDLRIQKQESATMGIKLMQVTHNVDYRGRVFLDEESLLKQQMSVDNLLEKHKRMRETLLQQKQIHQQKYQLSKYIKNQIRFCVIANFDDFLYSSRLYIRVLDSIFQQEYDNYHVVLIDDSIQNGNFNKSIDYMRENQIPTEKFKLIKNLKPQSKVHNAYMAVNNNCHQNEVVIFINQGQVLIGRQTLGILNSIYQKYQPAIVIPSFISIHQNQSLQVGNIPNSPQNIKNQNQNQTIRKMKDICNSFPLTFYADFFRKIDPQDLIQQNNLQFYQNNCAFTLPILQMGQQKIHFVPQLAFQYRQFIQIEETKQKQIQEILNKTPYKKLAKFSLTESQKESIKN